MKKTAKKLKLDRKNIRNLSKVNGGGNCYQPSTGSYSLPNTQGCTGSCAGCGGGQSTACI